MKRSEVTVEKLKALGYVAKKNFVNSWRFHSEETDLNERQAEELFEMCIRDRIWADPERAKYQEA